MKVMSPTSTPSLTKGKTYKCFNVKKRTYYGYSFNLINDDGDKCLCLLKECSHLNDMDWIIVNNRATLKDFITKNQIDMKATSLMLGKSKSWLATMCYESKRDDIKQSSLDRIIAALSIDWASKTPVMVNSKGYVPYSTIPANYSRTQDKARLMRAYLNGEVK